MASLAAAKLSKILVRTLLFTVKSFIHMNMTIIFTEAIFLKRGTKKN